MRRKRGSTSLAENLQVMVLLREWQRNLRPYLNLEEDVPGEAAPP
jgi:hypothetical protein